MKKVYFVNCYDSFSYNLVELLRTLSIPFKIVNVEQIDLKEVEEFSHILLSPGPKTPQDYPQLFRLLAAFYSSKSILGICLGHQTIGEYFGAKLERLSMPRHGEKRKIICTSSTLFKNLPTQFYIGLYHSWFLTKHHFPDALQITAECEEGTILSIQHQDFPIYGVQFHPESIMSEWGRELIENWFQEER